MRVIRSVIPFIVIAAFGIFMLIMSIKDKIELSKPPADIAQMSESDFYSGRFVEGDIYEIWGNYATLEQSDSIFGIKYNTKATAHYYLMPLETSYDTGIPKFISVAVHDSADILNAQKMEREFDRYLDSDDEVFEPVTVMHIKGKVTKLRKDAANIFDKTLSSMTFNPATDAVHYVINVGNDGSGTSTELILGIVVTIIGLFGGFIAFVRGRRRSF